MAEQFEFEVVFALPEGDHDPFKLSDCVFEAGFEDALVGTGIAGLVAVELEAEGDDAESAILAVAAMLLKHFPAGTQLREVRPDLVSLADVAKKLHVKRQALQQREMPPPSQGGLYRVDELADSLEKAMAPKEGQRRPRFDLEPASNWLRAGRGARRINAKLTINALDPFSLNMNHRDEPEERRAG
ncbi:hypothetical protein BJF93_11240 [Xaviernesmea oryzae]|uniref:DNA-binding protein n=1 Tax=Xaviernesmea oryzae TaxID=464029 RepID=A0A1Q9AW59_9HYPH|nr:hypothetical protein [Xaviernesmea oryzae]OLP59643.1 hypothetical protein BJF93_11240 [Xaviernesmea oryzae]SEM24231.1 hypothetical protein SAMN04487976_12431 [Xaviernesmea oryzae]